MTPAPDGLTALVSHLRETLFLASPDLSTISYVSKPMHQILSRPVPGLSEVSDLWRKLPHPDDVPLIKTQVSRVINQNTTEHLEFRVTPGSGRHLWIEVQLVPYFDDVGTVAGISGLITDITGQKDAAYAQSQAQEKEILIGARIQRTLLQGDPDQFVPGLTVAARTLPSQNVDGDFYDFYWYSETVGDVVVGDVMGKGISAALMGAATKTALMNAILTESVSDGIPPELTQTIARTESRLSDELMRLGRFVTMNLCRFDLQQEAVEFVDAGHTFLIHFRAHDNTIWQLKGANMPIGFVPVQQFVTKRLPIAPEDLLFLYSDGLTETKNGEDQFFGEQRVMYYLASHHAAPVETILSGLLGVVFDYSATTFADDVTGILFRVEKTAEPNESERSQQFRLNKSVLTKTRRYVQNRLTGYEMSEQIRTEVALAVHEAIANVWQHQYDAAETHHATIKVAVQFNSGWIYVGLEYIGTPYEIDVQHGNDMASPMLEYQEHGYGLQLIHSIMDSVILCQGLSGKLRLIMGKKIPPP